MTGGGLTPNKVAITICSRTGEKGDKKVIGGLSMLRDLPYCQGRKKVLAAQGGKGTIATLS